MNTSNEDEKHHPDLRVVTSPALREPWSNAIPYSSTRIRIIQDEPQPSDPPWGLAVEMSDGTDARETPRWRHPMGGNDWMNIARELSIWLYENARSEIDETKRSDGSHPPYSLDENQFVRVTCVWRPTPGEPASMPRSEAVVEVNSYNNALGKPSWIEPGNDKMWQIAGECLAKFVADKRR